MNKNNGGPAFPRPASEFTESGTLADGNDAIRHQDGMSLRDWFAGMSLMLSGGYVISTILDRGSKPLPEVAAVAAKAYEIADAMLKERGKE